MRALLAASLVVAVGCSPVVDRCRSQTLLVAVTLDGASSAADSFAVTLSIDGVTSMQTTVAHTPGVASGNLVVDFPHGYPRGHRVGIEVDAWVASVVVGSGSTSQALVADCEVAPLSIAATLAGDLGSDDAGGADLAASDLSPPPPDMVCVPTGAETGSACFDGVDNDCDGTIDCADSDCTAAQCVPAPSSAFTLGITTTVGGFCPAMFMPLVAQINEGLNASTLCPTNGPTPCTCTGVMNCSTQATSWPQSVCTGEGDGNSATSTMCRGFNVAAPTTGISTDVIVNGGGTCSAGGTSTPAPTTWTASDQFCKTTAIGGGCAPGLVCVPKLAVPTCELAANVVACDAGYNATAGTWYTGRNDTRQCTCGCGSATGGSCGSTIDFYTSSNCSGSPALSLGASQQNCNFTTTIHSVQLVGSSSPSCGSPTASLNGSASGTGPMTMCCRP